MAAMCAPDAPSPHLRSATRGRILATLPFAPNQRLPGRSVKELARNPARIRQDFRREATPAASKQGRSLAMSRTIARHIRIGAEHRRRIGSLANEHRTTPNQLVVELAIEALNHREWPQSPLEIQMLRPCPFTAQATARGMIAAGRSEEAGEIRREISKIVPELRDRSTASAVYGNSNMDSSPMPDAVL